MADTKLFDLVMSELLEEIEDCNTEILASKVRNAIREVKQARKYPDIFTSEVITKDLRNYISNIEALALYDYNQVGAEGESSHKENGVDRTWVSRNRCFNGINPIARIIKWEIDRKSVV